jgi:ribonuclease HII
MLSMARFTPPTFQHEEVYWQQGIRLVAGIDEVGMGALAGPVVAGAVIFPFPPSSSEERDGVRWGLIRDSKTLSAEQRDVAAKWVQANALAWAVGEASVAEITMLNIRRASHIAMRRAVDRLSVQPEMLLIDGHPASPHPSIAATNLIKGDQLSFSIAAASILAKVYRDALMVELHTSFPNYNFAGHKGYGSAQHLAALEKLGPSPHHRATYAPVARLLAPRMRG